MKLDILVLAAHPDDAELGCGGTILKHVSLGHKVGIVDFTRGELGTRGSVQTRDQEAAAASGILGILARENLDLPDGFLQNERSHQLAVIRAIRKYQPEIVMANAIYDRHSDHGKAAQLSHDACFLSGLIKIETLENGKPQTAWRPKALYHYIQSQLIPPDFIVDISGFWEKKMEAVRAYKTQFFDAGNQQPETYVSNPNFLLLLESRATEFGHASGARHGEGFTVRRFIGVKSLFDIF
jgi:bacillithiol biosynthesis deacetylase BshB1